MSLPKDLYPLAKDVLIPSKWLFGDDINAWITNIKLNRKSERRFRKIPGNQYMGYKTKHTKQIYQKAMN